MEPTRKQLDQFFALNQQVNRLHQQLTGLSRAEYYGPANKPVREAFWQTRNQLVRLCNQLRKSGIELADYVEQETTPLDD